MLYHQVSRHKLAVKVFNDAAEGCYSVPMHKAHKGGLLISMGFGLYRFAASRLYGSGLGSVDIPIGFVSNIAFVLAMNLMSCLAALVALLVLSRFGFRRSYACPWISAALLLLGVLLGMIPGIPFLSALQGILCGLGLFLLCITWFDIFVSETSASDMLAQLSAGVTLYTILECATAGFPGGIRTLLAACSLLTSCLLIQIAQKELEDRTGEHARIPQRELHASLPIYLSFFVLVGVVGIMHTSVLGSSSEYIIGAAPMWLTRVVSLAVFMLVVLPQGMRFNMTTVFKVAFPTLIGILTLLPFLGPAAGAFTGSLAITCYCICGMLIYVFIIREGRKLGLSSVLLATVYTLGSSGFLFCGLCIGLLLRTLSASFDASLLTLLAFASIYPLVLGLMFIQRRNVRVSNEEQNENDNKMAAHAVALNEAMDKIACEYGLTKREREVLPYLVSDSSIRYIAETLVISENTAWTHAKRIYAKTGTHGKDGLAAMTECVAAEIGF